MVLAAFLLSVVSLGSVRSQPLPLQPNRVAAVEALPRKGSLGVGFAPLSAELTAKYSLKSGEGALVSATVPGLTGEKAGLKAGDVIVSINDTPVTLPTIAALITTFSSGQTIKIKFLRDGKPQDVSVPLVERPRDPGNANYEVIYSEVLSNGHRMRTIISKPKSPGKHPALFFIQGYAPVSYDFNLEGPASVQRIDAPILFAFANDGFVTMRVEKPGVGDSEGGPFNGVDFVTELDIYRQALKQLKSLDYVDTDNVFIFGHSMGGAFGPAVAVETPVKGMCMYGVEARTWHEYILDTVRYQGLLAGQTYSQVDDGVRKASRLFELMFQDGKTADEIVKAHPELEATAKAGLQNGLFNGKTSTFWGQLENTNFAEYWAKVNTHVFAVHGASDFVSYEVDHRLIADIVNSVHPGWGKFATAPSSDHIFNNWATEKESLGHWPQGAFNPAFIGMLRSWVDEVMKGK